jgi:uncharacterized protein (DUF885 family)
MAEGDVVAEVERYIVWPGQACAYMVGKLKTLELRTRAQQALGAAYDEKAFHDVVLKNGAVPLTIIVKIVLDSTDDLRWLSVLLGDAAGAKAAPPRE